MLANLLSLTYVLEENQNQYTSKLLRIEFNRKFELRLNNIVQAFLIYRYPEDNQFNHFW